MRQIMVSILVVLIGAASGTARPQTTSDTSATASASASDPQAALVVSLARASLTGNSNISDVVLTGRSTWLAGSDYVTGNATLKARATGQSRIQFQFKSGQHTEIHSTANGFPAAGWLDETNRSHDLPLHNCWTDSNWFFPALSFLASDNPQLIWTYVGHETKDGFAVEHVRVSRNVPQKSAKTTALIRSLSTTDIYLDSTTMLPRLVTFNTHPDAAANIDIPVEVRFGDWRSVGTVRVPFRIQQLVNGSLRLDLVIDSATFNSGLSDSDFSLAAP